MNPQKSPIFSLHNSIFTNPHLRQNLTVVASKVEYQFQIFKLLKDALLCVITECFQTSYASIHRRLMFKS